MQSKLLVNLHEPMRHRENAEKILRQYSNMNQPLCLINKTLIKFDLSNS